MSYLDVSVTLLVFLCLAIPVSAQPALTCIPNNSLETFDNAPWTVGAGTSGCATVGTFDPNWTSDPADTNCWRVYTGSTPSYGGNGFLTGDHTTGSGNYLYTEGSPAGTTAGWIGTLYARFDATGLTNPTIEMWVLMYNINFAFNTNMGTLTVDYWDVNGGGPGVEGWTNALTISGDQGTPWNFASAPVGLNTGGDPTFGQIGCSAAEVLVRFQSTTGAGWESDIRIDDIVLKDPVLPEYEVNTPAGNVDIDGVQGTDLFPTLVSKAAVACSPAAPAYGVLNISSDQPGALWEVILHTDPLVTNTLSGLSGIVAPEKFNLNVVPNPAGVSTLNGGAGLNLTLDSFPGSGWPGAIGGAVVVPWALTSLPGGGLSFQGLMVYAGAPAGFDLTQATRLEISSSGNPAAACGPTGDEEAVMIDVTAAPLSATPITFYNTTYSTIYVNSNGRVTFDGAAPSFTPTAAAFLTSPQVGCWMDMDPGLGGNVEITHSAGVVKVSYIGVPYFGAAASSHTYDIEFDAGNFDTRLSGLGGIDLVSAAASDVIIGISAGLAAYTAGPATDPGIMLFTTPATAGVPVLATDMMYDHGVMGLPTSFSQVSPLTQITFANPAGAGLLSWATP